MVTEQSPYHADTYYVTINKENKTLRHRSRVSRPTSASSPIIGILLELKDTIGRLPLLGSTA